MPETTHAPLVPDGWELLDSRWAALWLDGTAHRLKPPTLGEFRKITEAVDVASAEVISATEALTSRLDEAREAIEAGQATNETMRHLNQELGGQQRDVISAAWFGVLTGIFDLLGQTQLPPSDDMPPWVTEDAANQVTSLIRHWKTAPPARGGR